MSKTTLTQAMIDAIITRSKHYRELKSANDKLESRLNDVQAELDEVDEVLRTLSSIVAQYEKLFDEIFVGSSDLPDLPMEKEVTDKSKLN